MNENDHTHEYGACRCGVTAPKAGSVRLSDLKTVVRPVPDFSDDTEAAPQRDSTALEAVQKAVATLIWLASEQAYTNEQHKVLMSLNRKVAALTTTPVCQHKNTEQLTGTVFRCLDCKMVGNPDSEIWGDPFLTPDPEPVCQHENRATKPSDPNCCTDVECLDCGELVEQFKPTESEGK